MGSSCVARGYDERLQRRPGPSLGRGGKARATAPTPPSAPPPKREEEVLLEKVPGGEPEGLGFPKRRGLSMSSLLGIKPQCTTSFDHHHPLPGALGLGGPMPPVPACLPSLPSGSRGPPGFRLWPCAALRPPAPSSPRGQRWERAPPSYSHKPPASRWGGRRLERRSNHPRIVVTLGDERKEVEFPSPAPTGGSSPSATTCPATRAPASLVSHCRDGGGKAGLEGERQAAGGVPQRPRAPSA